MRREVLLIGEMVDAVEWQQPSRLRNRIVHGYWSIDVGVLLTTAATQLPAFLDALRAVQATFEEPPDP